MSKTVTVFDAAWLGRARASTDKGSWIAGVLDSLDGDGTLYLDSIRVWFNKFLLVRSARSHSSGLKWWRFNRS